MSDPQDQVILLDITASMVGEGSDPTARNIWSEVIGRVEEQVANLPDGTHLAIVPFADGPRLKDVWPTPTASLAEPLQLETLDASSRKAALAYLANLQSRKPDGQVTWICDSVDYTLQQFKSWRTSQPAGRRQQTVFLYTDGADNGRCKNDFPRQFVNIFNGQRADYPFLYATYVDINQQLPATAITDIEGGTGGAATVVRDLPIIAAVAGVTSADTNLNNSQPVNVQLKVRNELPAGTALLAEVAIDSPVGPLQVQPAEVQLGPEMSISVTAAGPLPPGPVPATLRLTPRNDRFVFSSDRLPLNLSWQPVPLSLNTDAVDLGNLANSPGSFNVQLQSAPPSGRHFTADLVSDTASVKVEPASVDLAQPTAVTISGVSPTSGTHVAHLQVKPRDSTFVLTGGDSVPLRFAWSPPISVIAGPLGDSNLADHPRGVDLPLTSTSSSVVQPGAVQRVHVEVEPQSLGLHVEPSDITLAPSMQVKIFSTTPLDPGNHIAQLHIEPTSAGFSVPTDVEVPFTWQHHAAQIRVALGRDSSDFGHLEAGAAAPAEEFPLRLAFDQVAVDTGATARLRALVNGQERPDQLWFVGPDGQRQTTWTISPGDSEVEVGERLDAAGESRFLPGSEPRGASIITQGVDGDTHVAFVNADGTSGDSLTFSYAVDYPVTPIFALVLAIAGGIILTLFYMLGHARFPASAVIEVVGSTTVPLRGQAETSFGRRWFGASLTVGGPGDDIDVDAGRSIARLTPKGSGLGLFRRQTCIEPLDPSAALRVASEPVEGVRRLVSDDVITTPGLTMQYSAPTASAVGPDYTDYASAE
ncbi:MAG TPA: vWA domain-containing protein [Chloroflexota bacterium]